MHTGKTEMPERTETTECKEKKNKSRRRKRRGQEVLFKASVHAEISRVLPAQRLWLVGRRSEESQRVPGWSGW